MTDAAPPNTAPPEGSGPPWIDPEIQGRVEWRDGDIVVSVPPKSGTTWTMNIVHQLRTGGDPDFEDIYADVPWLEYVEYPGQTPQELLERWKAMPSSRPRAFKSHSSPPTLPFVERGAGAEVEVKYLVVLRDPREAAVSLKPFLERHSQAHFDQWKIPKEALVREDFGTFYDEVFEGMGFADMLFGFLAAWWPLRDRPNVHLLHFSDLKREPGPTIGTIADFLGASPSEEQWNRILEYCSFDWMKANQHKFEARTVGRVPVLEPGAMVRKGKVGAAHEDGMTDAIAARIRARGSAILDDPRALEWHYRGGPVPPV